MTDLNREGLEAAARALLAEIGFGFYTDPMECGHDAYEISCRALDQAKAAIRVYLPFHTPATDTAALVEALELIADPVAAMQKRADAEGSRLDGVAANALANDADFLRATARRALRSQPPTEQVKPEMAGLVEALAALRPFADAVFYDNGDVSVNLSVDSEDLIRAYFVHHRLSRALSTVPAKSAEGEVLHARVKRIMATTPYPESMSVFTAMMQLANELCPAQWEASPPAAAPAEPVAWQHKITEPNRPPQVLLSRSPDNPWSAWTEEHLGECAYSATPLFASPPAAAGVPEGWVLVPVEPTEAMLYAGEAISDMVQPKSCGPNTPESRREELRHSWLSMIAASPAEDGGR